MSRFIWTSGPFPVLTFHTKARLVARNIRNGDALEFTVQEKEGECALLKTDLIGQYNVANLLGVLACLRVRGLPLQQAAQICAHLQPAPGRMQCLRQTGQPLVAVDYAHTPDALEKALLALRPLAQARGGRPGAYLAAAAIATPTKRPLMGAVAARLADVSCITSDNPRSGLLPPS